MPPSPGPDPDPSGPDAAPAGVFSPVARRTARLVFAAALAAVGLWVARAFLIPLGWAAVLGVALWPLYRRVAARVRPGRRSVLPPLLFTLATGLVLLVPLGFAAVEVGRGGQAAAEWVGRMQESGIPEPGWLGRVPAVGGAAARWWREQG